MKKGVAEADKKAPVSETESGTGKPPASVGYPKYYMADLERMIDSAAFIAGIHRSVLPCLPWFQSPLGRGRSLRCFRDALG